MEQIVVLPEELKALIAMAVTVAVTQVLKWLSAQVNYDLSGFAAQVAAALVGAVLVFIHAAASNVPAEFAPIVNQVLILLVVVLGAKGLYKSFPSAKG